MKQPVTKDFAIAAFGWVKLHRHQKSSEADLESTSSRNAEVQRGLPHAQAMPLALYIRSASVYALLPECSSLTPHFMKCEGE